MYLKKVGKLLFLNQFFVGILKVSDENRRIRIRFGSADKDPDLHQNVMDPEHCCQARVRSGSRSGTIFPIWIRVRPGQKIPDPDPYV